MASVSISKKDVFWSYLATFFQLASGLITLPFILAKLSADEVGLNYLMITVGTLVSLFDFGFSNEHEKYFNQMRWMGFEPQRNRSEVGKTGSCSYFPYIWKSTELKDKFGSVLDVLDEMCSIRCIEHEGRLKLIAPLFWCPNRHLQGLRH